MVRIADGKRSGLAKADMFGILAYPAAFLSYWLQGQLISYPTAICYFAPAIPWAICITMVIVHHDKRAWKYWWVLPSCIPALFNLLLIRLMMLAWSIGGFV